MVPLVPEDAVPASPTAKATLVIDRPDTTESLPQNRLCGPLSIAWSETVDAWAIAGIASGDASHHQDVVCAVRMNIVGSGRKGVLGPLYVSAPAPFPGDAVPSPAAEFAAAP